MTTQERTLARLVDGLAEHGERPALVRVLRDGLEEVSYARLADRIARHASGLRSRGVERGESVVLFARPSVEWVVACLALVRAGAVPVPLDTQIEEQDLERILSDCGARHVLTDRRFASRLASVGHDARVVLLDAGEDRGARRDAGDHGDEDREARADEGRAAGDGAGDVPEDWRSWAADEPGEPPRLDADERALLFYTSGTTGPPKGVPLAHRHLAFQLDVAREVALLREDDRMLLPLPLHHVYPLVIGLLVPLELGMPVVLPRSLTGPQLLRALREGEPTAILGVPRIYAALVQGIDRRVRGGGRIARTLVRATIGLCTFTARRLRLRLGRPLLRPMRARVGARLRLLVSGGSALSPELGWTLVGLGWDVASGYGLTETAPLLTINPPGSRRLASAGRPVPGIELRIARGAMPDADDDAREASRPERDGHAGGDRASSRDGEDVAGEGEIQARGPGVFDGYLDLEEKTREAFTDDGWFRTGDLGWMDDGFLYVAGRRSTLIVTGSGEKIRTEEVEEAYARHELVEEIGILEEGDELAAVVVPARAELRRRDGDDADEAIHAALGEQGRTLPSHQRVAHAVTSPSPLERTRLGKLRRHRLRERYEDLREGGGERARREPMPIEEMSPQDKELLADEAARGVWDLFARRFPDAGLTPDASPQLDLGIDSLGWLDLGVAIEDRTGIELDEQRLAGIERVRDLLEIVAEEEPEEGAAHQALSLEDPEAALDEGQRRWLAPVSPAAAGLVRGLSHLNRATARVAFRLDARGHEHLPGPGDGPVILAPNHASYLDPFVVAAALPEAVRARTAWGGWTGVAFGNPLLRGARRLGRVLPVDPERAVASSLTLAAAALERGLHLVWFPEGRRSRDGGLGTFRPGIGVLLEARGEQPVVPVHVEGAFEAWPPRRRLPRPGRVRVTFGAPCSPAELAEEGEGESARERIASGLRERVRALAERA